MSNKALVTIASLLAAASMFATAADAKYPDKPITLVSPYGPGGNADLAARTLAAVAEKYLGQKVLVVNKAGAGGITGSTYVLSAKKDGYTLLLARVGPQAVAPAMDASVPYKWDDFTQIGMLETDPYVCVVQKDSPIKSFDDFVAKLKEKPGAMSYASTSVMDNTVVFPVTIFQNIGLGMNGAIKIPYQGGGAAVAAIMGNQVDFSCNGISPYASGLKSGDLRALVSSSRVKLADLPDVPTAEEVNMPNLEVVSGWSALYGPPDLPKDVVAKWTEVLEKVSKDPEWQSLVAKRGSVASVMSPEETKAFVEKQFNALRTLAIEVGAYKKK